jgi:hypothetical protein
MHFVVVLALSFGPGLAAQGIEQYLLPLDRINLNLGKEKATGEDGGNCGAYFWYSGVPEDKTKFGVLVFIFAPDLNSSPRDMNIPLMATDKLVTYVIEGKDHPMVVVLPQLNTPIYPWFHVLVSPEEFARMPCLKYTTVLYKN